MSRAKQDEDANHPKMIMKNPADLRPHHLHRELYGGPTNNSVYKDLRAEIKAHGFDSRHAIQVSEDGRVLAGVTRWHIAKVENLKEIPCYLFTPEDPANAELEMEQQVIRDNKYRVKSEVMIAREQRKLLEVESALARRRMGEGKDEGPSRAADRVGKIYKQSGKTVQRHVQVVDAIDEAEQKGNRKRAERLTELLNAKKIVKALDVIKGKRNGKSKTATSKKAVEVEEFPTCDAHFNKSESVFEAGCALVKSQGDLDAAAQKWVTMWGHIDVARTRNNLETPTVKDSQGRRLTVSCPIPLTAPEGDAPTA
jgi:ParB-like chromosome segregation protein Spo0J